MCSARLFQSAAGPLSSHRSAHAAKIQLATFGRFLVARPQMLLLLLIAELEAASLAQHRAPKP